MSSFEFLQHNVASALNLLTSPLQSNALSMSRKLKLTHGAESS